jgi:hypothetical protein
MRFVCSLCSSWKIAGAFWLVLCECDIGIFVAVPIGNLQCSAVGAFTACCCCFLARGRSGATSFFVLLSKFVVSLLALQITDVWALRGIACSGDFFCVLGALDIVFVVVRVATSRELCKPLRYISRLVWCDAQMVSNHFFTRRLSGTCSSMNSPCLVAQSLAETFGAGLFPLGASLRFVGVGNPNCFRL